MSAITAIERELMEHALGRSYPNKTRDYRNHFAAEPDGPDWPVWMALADRGLARAGSFVNERGGMRYFHVTEDGKAALDARPPPPCFLCRILHGFDGGCLEHRR